MIEELTSQRCPTVDANSDDTLECARTRSKIIKSINTNSLSAQTDQTGYADRSDRCPRETIENLKPQAREGPVGAIGARVALRSAGHSERHRTS